MRKFAVLATTLAVVGVIAAVAYAATTASLTATVTPSKAGTKRHPKIVGQGISASLNPGTATDTITVYLDKHLKLHGQGLPSCTVAHLDQTKDPNSCPRGSKLGGGTGQEHIGASVVNFNVYAFNGPRGSLTLFVTVGSIQKGLSGVIQNASGLYGKRIFINIPDNLRHPAPGVSPTLDNLSFTAKGSGRVHGKRVGWLESTGCSRGHRYNFKIVLGLRDGSKATATDTSPCR